jgi:predicted tellurium resistance membrane protein TerC
MKMENQTAKIIAVILGVVGIALILAGPAFHLVESTPALYAGIICFIVAGAIKAFFRKAG